MVENSRCSSWIACYRQIEYSLDCCYKWCILYIMCPMEERMRHLVAFMQIIFVLCVFSMAHGADWTPLQVSLVHPVQLFSKTTPVQGLRINLIYGVNEKVDGMDWGLVNRVTQESKGMQLGALPFGGANITKDLQGLQFAGLGAGMNVADGEAAGLQVAGLLAGFNKAHNITGVQLAAFIGINVADDMRGAQIAFVCNRAVTAQGLQIGMVNVCERMQGIQIGLVNIIREGRLPVFPILNAQF